MPAHVDSKIKLFWRGETHIAKEDVSQPHKRRPRKSFGADVVELVSSRHGPEFNHTVSTAFLEVADTNGDVFLLLAELWHLAHRNRRTVVNKQGSWRVLGAAEIHEDAADKGDLTACL